MYLSVIFRLGRERETKKSIFNSVQGFPIKCSIRSPCSSLHFLQFLTIVRKDVPLSILAAGYKTSKNASSHFFIRRPKSDQCPTLSVTDTLGNALNDVTLADVVADFPVQNRAGNVDQTVLIFGAARQFLTMGIANLADFSQNALVWSTKQLWKGGI